MAIIVIDRHNEKATVNIDSDILRIGYRELTDTIWHKAGFRIESGPEIEIIELCKRFPPALNSLRSERQRSANRAKRWGAVLKIVDVEDRRRRNRDAKARERAKNPNYKPAGICESPDCNKSWPEGMFTARKRYCSPRCQRREAQRAYRQNK